MNPPRKNGDWIIFPGVVVGFREAVEPRTLRTRGRNPARRGVKEPSHLWPVA